MRIIELFAGIGACSKALKNIGIDVEIVDAVEIDKYAIQSFNAIHGTNFETQDITKWDKINESCRRVYSDNGLSPTIHTCQGGNTEPKVLVKNATKKGYAEAYDGDSINLTYPNSEARRGRVGKQVSQTLQCNDSMGVITSERITNQKTNSKRMLEINAGLMIKILKKHDQFQ